VRTSWVGSRVRVAPGASVVNSVLGDDVVVESGAVVLRSVVLAGTRVGARERLRDEAAYLGVRVSRQGLRPAPPEAARHLRRVNWDTSAALGWLLAVVVLLLSIPILAMVALAILVEDVRPVFFRQARVGEERRRVPRDLSRRVVRILKFRTMYKEGDPRRSGPEWKADDPDAIFGLAKGDDDPRCTKVGRFLRRTSLDELPQLWNVLRGDMRLVGNRALAVGEAERMDEEWFQIRFRAPQGITGLWQVSGRSNLSDAERLALDNYYASSRSFWLDVRILMRTVPALLRQKGAK